MRNIFLIIFSVLFCATLEAQDLRSFKKSLMMPNITLWSQVEIVEHDNLAMILDSISDSIQIEEINGFRVSIYVDNSQTARANAEEEKSRFETEFPGVCAYLTYKSPDFIVTVGDYATMDEATILWGLIKASFDRAFIVRESVKLEALYSVPEVVVQAVDSTMSVVEVLDVLEDI